MTPDELRGEALRRWSWQREIRHQVINTDIDGLLSGALLHDRLGWPIAGLSDTRSLWLGSRVRTPLDLGETAWVDLAMCMPGARCIDQHVVCTSAAEAAYLDALQNSLNPNLVVGSSHHDYTTKYPYGTFQWVAWLLKVDPMLGSPTSPVGAGFAWMPDGGFASILKYRRNCLSWAEALPGSLLAPSLPEVRRDPEIATKYVQDAEAYLRERLLQELGARQAQEDQRCWKNHQWRMSEAWRPQPFVDPRTDHWQIQCLLDSITEFFGWRRAIIPTSYRQFRFVWSSGDRVPGWPSSAKNGQVVSAARTGMNRWCWSEIQGGSHTRNHDEPASPVPRMR